MIDGPQIPHEPLERQWLYEAALQEVVECIPPALTDATLIRMDDVRTLMVGAWLRGASWQKEHRSDLTVPDSAPEGQS